RAGARHGRALQGRHRRAQRHGSPAGGLGPAPAHLPDPEGPQSTHVLMNIECENETLAELENSFKFSDAVLRHLIVKMPRAVTSPSPMMKEEKSKSLMERGAEARPADIPA